jgi:hypothetical protein
MGTSRVLVRFRAANGQSESRKTREAKVGVKTV